jgi:uncharacterized membrane protein YphA (DoxX/SURF4 family)
MVVTHGALASTRTTLDKGLDLLGRLAVAFLFVDAARYHLTSGWAPTLTQMQGRGVAFPQTLLVIAMAVSIALSVALVLGVKERLAALGLALYAIGVSAVMYNPFAHLGTVSLIFFLKDLCIFGALLSLSRALQGTGWRS